MTKIKWVQYRSQNENQNPFAMGIAKWEGNWWIPGVLHLSVSIKNHIINLFLCEYKHISNVFFKFTAQESAILFYFTTARKITLPFENTKTLCPDPVRRWCRNQNNSEPRVKGHLSWAVIFDTSQGWLLNTGFDCILHFEVFFTDFFGGKWEEIHIWNIFHHLLQIHYKYVW